MSILPEPMDEAEARIVQDGFLAGNLDYLDLQGIAQDYEAWVAESETHTAERIRQKRQHAERAALAAEAEELLVSLMQNEVQQTFQNCDADPLTLGDFIADAITVLQRVQAGEIGATA